MPTIIMLVLQPNRVMDNANNGARLPPNPIGVFAKVKARLLFLINQWSPTMRMTANAMIVS